MIDGAAAPAWRRVHLFAGVLVVAALPLLSWVDGSGQLAWTMFSRTGTYRLEIRATGPDAAGARGPSWAVAPSALAALATGRARDLLAGADVWRLHDLGRFLIRRHLADLAALTCRAEPRAARVDLVLFDRANPDAPARTTAAGTDCVR